MALHERVLEIGDAGECAICLEDLRVGMRGVSLACAHVFHSQCIRDWAQHKAECPVCRKPLKDSTCSAFAERKAAERKERAAELQRMIVQMRALEEDEKRAAARANTKDREDIQREKTPSPRASKARSGLKPNRPHGTPPEPPKSRPPPPPQPTPSKTPGKLWKGFASALFSRSTTRTTKTTTTIRQSTTGGRVKRTKTSSTTRSTMHSSYAQAYPQGAAGAATGSSSQQLDPKSLSVAEIKRRLSSVGADTSTVIERRELENLLVQCLQGKAGLKQLPISVLKSRLRTLKVDTRNALSKSDLVESLANVVAERIKTWKPDLCARCSTNIASSNVRKGNCAFCGLVFCGGCLPCRPPASRSRGALGGDKRVCVDCAAKLRKAGEKPLKHRDCKMQ